MKLYSKLILSIIFATTILYISSVGSQTQIIDTEALNTNSTISVDTSLKLKFELKTKYFEINPDINNTIPTILNVRAGDTGEFSKVKKQIIFLIDKSTSMGGTKIEMVREFLRLMLKFLTKNEEIQLIFYDNNIRVYNIENDFFTVTNENKEALLEQINNLYSSGGTNIRDPLKKAFEIFESKKQTKEAYIKTIILLTDGEDNNRDLLLNYLNEISHDVLNKVDVIHCVGYGMAHDTEVLKLISEMGRGNYIPTLDSENVKKDIGDILGAILSVFDKNVKIKIELSPGVKINKSLSKFLTKDEILSNVFYYDLPIISYNFNYDIAFELLLENEYFKTVKESNINLMNIYTKKPDTDWEKIETFNVKLNYSLDESQLNKKENLNIEALKRYIALENGLIIETNKILIKEGNYLEAMKVNNDRVVHINYMQTINPELDMDDENDMFSKLNEVYEKGNVQESLFNAEYLSDGTSNYGKFKKRRGKAQEDMINEL